MSYEQSVIAEVQARYGVPVTGAVQVIPRGKSGMPEVYWDEDEGQLRFRSNGGERLNGTGTIKQAQKVMRGVHQRQKKFERAAKKMEAAEKPAKAPTMAELYGGRIAVLAGQGKTSAEIAADLKINIDTMRAIASRLGIKIVRPKRFGNTKRVGCISAHVKERRADILQAITAGIPHATILEGLSISAKTFVEDLRLMGIKANLKGCEKAEKLLRRHVSDETCNRVAEMHKDGHISADIASALGVHVRTVRRALRCRGLTANVEPRKLKQEQLERHAAILAFSAKGLPNREISAKTGAAISTISAVIRAARAAA